MATWDKAETLDSARSLRQLDPTILVVGHGPAVPAPGPAIDAALTRAARSARAARAAA
jgi:glyoxylase-like metal-dependent hydrolase (beta-lactamase superfamily II)